jgi:hypothetical protein
VDGCAESLQPVCSDERQAHVTVSDSDSRQPTGTVHHRRHARRRGWSGTSASGEVQMPEGPKSPGAMGHEPQATVHVAASLRDRALRVRPSGNLASPRPHLCSTSQDLSSMVCPTNRTFVSVSATVLTRHARRWFSALGFVIMTLPSMLLPHLHPNTMEPLKLYLTFAHVPLDSHFLPFMQNPT